MLQAVTKLHLKWFFLFTFSLFNCQKQNYRDVKLHSCECKMLSTKMERFMSVVNTIFYRAAEAEIVIFVVHLCFHEMFMKRSDVVQQTRGYKVQIIWEGYKKFEKTANFVLTILNNLKKQWDIVFKFCGLLTISEL